MSCTKDNMVPVYSRQLSSNRDKYLGLTVYCECEPKHHCNCNHTCKPIEHNCCNNKYKDRFNGYLQRDKLKSETTVTIVKKEYEPSSYALVLDMIRPSRGC